MVRPLLFLSTDYTDGTVSFSRSVFLSHADVADFTEWLIVSLAAVGCAECFHPEG